MTDLDNFIIIYAPGSGGSFLTQLITAYKYGLDPKILNIDFATGNAHEVLDLGGVLCSHNNNLTHVHQLYPEHQVVLIDYDEDDMDIMLDMVLNKIRNHIDEIGVAFGRTIIEDAPRDNTEFIKAINKIALMSSPKDVDECIQLLRPALHMMIQTWLDGIDLMQVSGIIQFRTIMGFSGDLNQEISDMLSLPLRQDLVPVIKSYQEINQHKYF